MSTFGLRCARSAAGLTLAVVVAVLAGCDTPVVSKHAFEGATVRVVVGAAPGGGYDLQARIVARYFGAHLPGQPNVVVENMTGAGGLVAVNYLANIAKPDGLTIGYLGLSAILPQLLGQSGVQYDIRQFHVIGAPTPEPGDVCVVASQAPWDVDRWREATRPLRLGVFALGSNGHLRAALLADALGLPSRLVAGYRGTADLRLALEASEVDVVCVPQQTYRLAFGQPGRYRAILQTGRDAGIDVRGVPSADAQPLAPGGSALLDLLARLRTLDRYFVVPRDTPPDRVSMLRRAFEQTTTDGAFGRDAAAIGVDFQPMRPDEAELRVKTVFELPESVQHELRTLLKKTELGVRP